LYRKVFIINILRSREKRKMLVPKSLIFSQLRNTTRSAALTSRDI
jgi:hypothetical protein